MAGIRKKSFFLLLFNPQTYPFYILNYLDFFSATYFGYRYFSSFLSILTLLRLSIMILRQTLSSQLLLVYRKFSMLEFCTVPLVLDNLNVSSRGPLLYFLPKILYVPTTLYVDFKNMTRLDAKLSVLFVWVFLIGEQDPSSSAEAQPMKIFLIYISFFFFGSGSSSALTKFMVLLSCFTIFERIAVSIGSATNFNSLSWHQR